VAGAHPSDVQPPPCRTLAPWPGCSAFLCSARRGSLPAHGPPAGPPRRIHRRMRRRPAPSAALCRPPAPRHHDVRRPDPRLCAARVHIMPWPPRRPFLMQGEALPVLRGQAHERAGGASGGSRSATGTLPPVGPHAARRARSRGRLRRSALHGGLRGLRRRALALAARAGQRPRHRRPADRQSPGDSALRGRRAPTAAGRGAQRPSRGGPRRGFRRKLRWRERTLHPAGPSL